MHTNTKMKFTVLNFALILLFNFSSAQKNPSHFKSEIDFGGGIIMSTFFNVTMDREQFSITSPKNADVRIMGGKARLGRLFGMAPKKGIIMAINGTQKSDSLFGETTIPMFGKLKFRGTVKNNTLSGEFLKNNAPMGTLHGVTSAEDKMDYRELYPKLVKTIEDNIYSTDALQHREWEKFKKELEKLCNEAHDDIELYFGFNMMTKKLPFTHLSLLIAEDIEQSEDIMSPEKTVIFEEKNESTAYIRIKNFSTSTDELAAVLPKIVENSAYKNLIIDLRDNGGGGVGPAFELAKYIVTEDVEVGYFVTNKLDYSGFEPELFRTLPPVQPKSTYEFGNQLKTSPGVKLVFKKPTNPVFTGNIYILANGNTGSTCEPIVYAFKNNKKATIVGEKTAGAMLAASPFTVSGKYVLMLPISDFYTYDGVRLDKVGVSPDVEVKSAEALDKALEIINTGKK